MSISTYRTNTEIGVTQGNMSAITDDQKGDC